MNLNELIEKIENLPNDEKISYGVITLGVLFIIISFFLW
tara:strand:- start:331 stop:447 length:117 start_codon:yes stop_codon:yes gene_type:complete